MTYYPPNTHQTRDPLIVSTLFGVFALLSLVGRFCSLHLRSQRPKIEEVLVTAGLLLTYVSLGIQWACVVRGATGRHMTDPSVQAADVVMTLKLILPFEALYGITLMLIKLGVLQFYKRTLSVRPWFRIAAVTTAAFIVAWAASVILETFLLCRPLAFNWDSTVPGGVCGDRNAVYVVAGVTNLATDVMVLLLPIPAIWQLQMPVGQKLGLVAIFSMGIFITAISIVRLHSLTTISFEDPTWTLPMGLLWTVLEPELVVINANLPFLRLFFAHVFPRAFSLSRGSRNRRYGDNNYGQSSGSKNAINPFNKLTNNNNNIIAIQTIGGGYRGERGRDNIDNADNADNADNISDTQAPSGTGSSIELTRLGKGEHGIIQERTVRVDYEDAYHDSLRKQAKSNQSRS